MALKESYKDKLLSIIHKYIPQCKVYLFGSRAIGEERSGSDIDIAIDAGSKISRDIILKMLIDVDDTIIPMSVDIVDLHAVSDDFKKEVLLKGIRWK